MSRITTVQDKIPQKASWPGFLASGKDSRTKVVLARKLEKQGLGSTPVTGASALPRFFSRLTLASASSPKMDLAYRLAAMNPHSPERACKKRWMTKHCLPHFDSNYSTIKIKVRKIYYRVFSSKSSKSQIM